MYATKRFGAVGRVVLLLGVPGGGVGVVARPALGRMEPESFRGLSGAIQGPELGDYLGLPINDSARLFAESWDASRLTLKEHQCRVHISPYIYHGPLHLRVWKEKDPETQQVIAIKNYISTRCAT